MGRPAAIRPSTAFTTVDLDKPGNQIGFVMIPHSPMTMRGARPKFRWR